MYCTYKLVNKATGAVHYTTNLLEAGEGYDILKLDDGTEIRFENVEMDGSNLTNEEYAIEKFEKYVVTQENLDSNPFFATLGIPVGAEVEYDPAVVISREEAIAQGIDVEKVEKEAEDAKVAAEEKAAEEAEAERVRKEQATAGVTAAPKEPKRFYEGKVIIAEYPREVNGKTYHHIRLADGSTQDLTDEKQALIVIEK